MSDPRHWLWSRSYEIEDTHEGEPSEFFEDSAAIIARIKEERSLIFVHCTEGKSIAPTIVLNYMMQSAKKQNKHLSLLAAYNFLGAKAPGINVTDQFMAQLLGTNNTPAAHRCLRPRSVSLFPFPLLSSLSVTLSACLFATSTVLRLTEPLTLLRHATATWLLLPSTRLSRPTAHGVVRPRSPVAQPARALRPPLLAPSGGRGWLP